MRKRLNRRDSTSSSSGRGTVSIETFERRDIEDGMRLKASSGWNQTENDWRTLLDLSGSGSVCARIGNLFVGSALVLEYKSVGGGRIGWVSMVLVDPSFRRRGIGTELLEEAISRSAELDVHMLDATQAGVPVYEHFGFVPYDKITRWRLRATDRSAGGEGTIDHFDNSVHPSADSLLAADRRATGFIRPRLIDELVRRWDPIVTRSGGVAFGRDGSGAHQIGPVISSSPDEAVFLVGRAVESIGGELIVDIRDRRTQLAEFVSSLGFVRERGFFRMARSESRSFPMPTDSLAAIAGPEFG